VRKKNGSFLLSLLPFPPSQVVKVCRRRKLDIRLFPPTHSSPENKRRGQRLSGKQRKITLGKSQRRVVFPFSFFLPPLPPFRSSSEREVF